MNIIKRRGVFWVALATVAATFLVNFYVRLYGDDFFYLRFTSGDFFYYVSRHFEHYFRANGRVVVHLLSTAFLGLDPYVWRIFNSLLLGALVYFGARLSNGRDLFEKGGREYLPAVIISSSILLLNISMTRQSVYWLTGSFNYVYPILMLIIYWYFLNRTDGKGKKGFIPVLAFLAAATTEQVSVMVFGLTLLFVLERVFIQKTKPEKVYILALAVSFLGAASVLLAPSVFYRNSIEDAPAVGLFNLLKYNVINEGATFLFSKMMAPYHIMAFTCALGITALYRNGLGKRLKAVGNVVLLLGLISFLCWFYQIITRESIINRALSGRYAYLFFLFIGLTYFTLLLYSALAVYVKNRDYKLPLLSLLLLIGSQVIMLVSPVYGPRNLLSAVFMLTLYSSFMVIRLDFKGVVSVIGVLLCIYFEMPLLLIIPAAAFFINGALKSKWGSYLAYSFLALISAIVFSGTVHGYAVNSRIYDVNLAAAETYREQGEKGILTQYRFKDDAYGWAMPYHNPYYDPYYRDYLKIPGSAKVNWLSFK